MGAESSAYQDIELEDKYEVSIKNVLIHPAKAKDGSKVTVFVYEKSGHLRVEHVDNAAKQLKRLRHPSILKFLTLAKHSSENWLITEQVKPLETVLDTLNSFEICAGLYNIIEALSFLHERGRVCHNNISLHSIFVSENGTWKLGGMEYLCKFEEATKDYLNKSKETRDPNSISPEEKDGKVNTTGDFGHARDAYSFGVLAEQLLEYMTDLGDMIKTFELRIQDEFLNPDPKERPKFATILDDRLFKNDFLDIINFLNQVTLKSDEEKKEFFSNLVPRLYQLPEMIIAQRLVHPLLSRFVLLDETADEYLVPHLLKPSLEKERPEKFVEGEINPVLTEGLYRRYIIPELYRIYHVRDAHIRLILLKHFKLYVKLFDHKTLRSIILPQILLGLLDTNDLIVELTLNALADVMPILGGDVVIGKHREKIFAEGKPRLASDSPFKPDSLLKELNNSSKNSNTTRTQKGIIKTPTLPSSTEKVTLKDLAKQVDLAKQTEREKRREEAKRRSEERRKKREEAKKSPKKATLATAGDEGLTEETPDAEEKWSEWDKNEDEIIDKTQTNSEEINEDKWSDIDEEDFEDEIENELNSMDSTLSPGGRTKIVDTNDIQRDTSYQKSDPIKVDWMDVNKSEQSSSHRHKKGALQLSVQKSKSSPPPESHLKSFDDKHGQKEVKRQNVSSEKADDFENDWGQGWSEEIEGPEEPTKTVRSNSIDKKPLGAEYDVLSIEIKPKEKSDEFDFFADMTPVIKTPNLIDTLSKTQNRDIGSGSKGSASQSKSTLSFAMADVEEVTGGWGDDDDDIDLEND